MSKTLTDFRAERGLYLTDVAEAIAVPLEELQAVDNCGAMPPHIAEKLVTYYGLPKDYFNSGATIQAQIQKKTPSNSFRYFFVASLLWIIISNIIISLPLCISTIIDTASIMITSFTGVQLVDFIAESTIFSIFGSVWSTGATIIMCIAFADYILKKTTFTGNIKRNQFLNCLIPNGMIMALSTINSTLFMAVGEKFTSLMILVSFASIVISTVITIVEVFLLAVMLNLSVESDIEKRNKNYRLFAIITTISVLITFVFNIVVMVVTGDFQIFTVIRTFIFYTLYIIIAWMLAKLKDGDEHQEKLVCTILPLAFYGASLVLSVVGTFI